MAEQTARVDEAGKDRLPEPVFPHPSNVLRAQLCFLHQTESRVLIADDDIGLLWIEVTLALRSAALLILLLIEPLRRSNTPFDAEMGMH